MWIPKMLPSTVHVVYAESLDLVEHVNEIYWSKMPSQSPTVLEPLEVWTKPCFYNSFPKDKLSFQNRPNKVKIKKKSIKLLSQNQRRLNRLLCCLFTESIKAEHLLSCKCCKPGIISLRVQRRRSAPTPSQSQPHSHYLYIAPIFHPLSSKQPQTVQLTINTHNLQNLRVSQEPNCLLLDWRQSLHAHL